MPKKLSITQRISRPQEKSHTFFLPDFKPEFSQEQKQWRPLHLLNLYRLLISGLFVSLIFANSTIGPFGALYPKLFQVVSLAYLIGSILNGITIRWHWPAIWFQTHSHIIFDLCALILIMHSSGGVKSGVGLLLLIPIAAISILSFGRSSLFYAALTTLILFADQSYLQLTYDISNNYAQSGLLGGILFLIALLTNYLVKKSEDSIEIASQKQVDLENMEQLTQFIMQRMQTAVIVIDYLANIKVVNNTAISLLKLNKEDRYKKTNLFHYSPELNVLFKNWQRNSNYQTHSLIMKKDTSEFTIKFASLGTTPQSGTVIFIEDNAELTQTAQQLKLASLGRLTASIAHELRNPLAAIRHAGELLSESPSLDKMDHRLTEIIEKQSIRVNDIIGTVLDLSRRQQPEQKNIKLYQWIQEFLDEYIQLPRERFYLKFESDDLEILFDQQHLHQIINNLIQNALRHTIEYNHHFRPVVITAGTNGSNNTVYLQVMNYGTRIPKKDLSQLFEPFFTTEATGTGLGLYIAREMSLCNGAKLEYIDIKEGACFQITFVDPRRKKQEDSANTTQT